jgi:small-conductance mechanosensitive channel
MNAPRPYTSLAYSLSTILVIIVFLALSLASLFQLLESDDSSTTLGPNRFISLAYFGYALIAFLSCLHLLVAYYHISLTALNDLQDRSRSGGRKTTLSYVIILIVFVFTSIGVKRGQCGSSSAPVCKRNLCR